MVSDQIRENIMSCLSLKHDALLDFQLNRLAPFGTKHALTSARMRLSHQFRFCPLTINTTTIFNMASLERLQKLVVGEEELSNDEVAECQKAIFALLGRR